MEVLIAGAGPTGLMTAALLARHGVKLRIIDKNAGAVKESRALALQARSLELFLKMGLEKPFLEAGTLANGARVHTDGNQIAELTFDDVGRDDTPYTFVLFIPQSTIEEILVADLQAHGIEVERGCELTSLSQTADRVQVGLLKSGEPETVECDYVVGADGSHSAVRKGLHLAFEGAPYESSFLLADCSVEGPLEGDRINIFLRDQRIAIQFPLMGKNLSRLLVQVLDTDASHPQGSSSDITLEEVQTGFREVSHTDSRLSNPAWLSRYKVHHRGVNQYRVGRGFVAGDAAHIHSPAGGQGMNTGLQDAANLAWKLAYVIKYGATTALLETYQAERWPVGDRVLKDTDRAFTTIAQPQTGWRAVLKEQVAPMLMGTLTKLGVVRSRAFHYVSQLGIHYEPNLAVANPSSAKALLKPGRRAPNAHLQRHLDMFDVLAGYEFDLLAISHRALTAAEVAATNERLETLRESTGMPLKTYLIGHCLSGRNGAMVRTEYPQVFTAYGLEGPRDQALVLVRPDGYVAYSAPGFDWDALQQFLARLTVTPAQPPPPAGGGGVR